MERWREERTLLRTDLIPWFFWAFPIILVAIINLFLEMSNKDDFQRMSQRNMTDFDNC